MMLSNQSSFNNTIIFAIVFPVVSGNYLYMGVILEKSPKRKRNLCLSSTSVLPLPADPNGPDRNVPWSSYEEKILLHIGIIISNLTNCVQTFMVWVEEYNEKKRSRYEITKDYGHLCPFVPGFREALQTHFRLKLGFCSNRLDTPDHLPPNSWDFYREFLPEIFGKRGINMPYKQLFFKVGIGSIPSPLRTKFQI